MKLKTSITLSEEVLRAVDGLAGPRGSRSAVIERALIDYLRQRAKSRVESRELDRLNAAAARLNAEATDVLEYQSNAD